MPLSTLLPLSTRVAFHLAALALAPPALALAARLPQSVPEARQQLVALERESGRGEHRDERADESSESTAAEPVRIGQPLRWTLVVTLPAGEKIATWPEEPEPGDGWLRTSGPRPLVVAPRRVHPEETAGPPALAVAWELIPLEPGARATPPLEVTLESGTVLVAPSAAIEVLGELAEDEDAPRGLHGFRDVPDREVLSPGALVAGIGGLVGLVGLGLYLRRRARLRPLARAAGPTNRERLAALDPRSGPAEVLAGLGPLLRDEIDRLLGANNQTLTDSEWGAQVERDQRVPEELARTIAGIADESAAVRYGAGSPSTLAAQTALEAATAALDAIEARIQQTAGGTP